MKFKRLYEKKFRNSAAAVDYLDKAGWKYDGFKGMVRRRHQYSGVSIGPDGNVAEYLRVHLKPDGHVVMFNRRNVSGTCSVSSLPCRVWESKDMYDFVARVVKEMNGRLQDGGGGRYLLQDIGHRKFGVYSLARVADRLGATISSDPVQTFETPTAAFNWASTR